MRIQKEIDNIARVKDKIATMPLTMEDAIEFHKRAVAKIEKDRKEANKAMGIKEKDYAKGFTGASAKPKKITSPGLKKMHLVESIFEDFKKNLNEANEEDENLFDDEDDEEEDKPSSLNRKSNSSSWRDSADLFNSRLDDIRAKERRSLQKYDRDLYKEHDWENEYKDWAYEQGIEEPDAAGFDDWLENDLGYNEKDRSIIRKEMEKDELRKERLAKEKERDDAAREEERKRKEAEDKRKRDEDNLASSVWGEKDWIAEREKAGGLDNLDLDDYSEAEKAALQKKFDEFDNDEEAQRKYLRQFKERTMKEKEEADKQAKKEKDEKLKKRFDKASQISKTVTDTPTRVKNRLSKLGINIH